MVNRPKFTTIGDTMSRKDYIKIAAILADYSKKANTPPFSFDHFAFGKAVNDFADMFANDNPNFNRAKFIEACYA
jgi:thermostable 8-oxoguanine DNA glycosylase